MNTVKNDSVPDLILVASELGPIVMLEYDPTKTNFVKVKNVDTKGRSCEQLAANPEGRALFISIFATSC